MERANKSPLPERHSMIWVQGAKPQKAPDFKRFQKKNNEAVKLTLNF